MGKKKGTGTREVQSQTKKSGDGLGGSLEAHLNDDRDSTASQSNQIVICKSAGCHDISTTHSFCRFHYLASWRKLKTKEAKRKGVELKAYLTDLSRKFPEDFLEKLRSELDDSSEKSASSDSDDDDRNGLFDPVDGDEDIDTIIKGIKVEDF
jgi:hypothetical protein